MGGLRFDVICDQPLADPPAAANGRLFYSSEAGSAPAWDTRVVVNVAIQDRASLPESAPTFDGGPWRCWKTACGFLFAGRARHASVWTAELDTRARTANVVVTRGKANAGEVFQTPFVYPLDQLVTLHLLSALGGVLVHSAGIVSDGAGLLCAGVSGAGKSTISGIAVRAGLRVLSDDRIIVRGGGGGFLMYGTPWPGDARIAVNEAVPLRALLLLRQASENRVESVGRAEAFRGLAPTCSIPWYDPPLTALALDALDELLRTVPAADFHFTRAEGAAETLRAFARAGDAARG